MKITVYIINAILFMGCCLLVSTTTPNVTNVDVNNKITYVKSETITKEEPIIESIPVEKIEPIEEENTFEKEPIDEVVESVDKNINYQEEIKPNEETINQDETINTNNETFTGRMSGYGADIGTHTAYGYCITDTITYLDQEYGEIRILSGGREYPFGTIVKVSNTNVGDFIGIVLDRGPDIGKDQKFMFDLLFQTSSEALSYGVSNNASFEILRVGF